MWKQTGSISRILVQLAIALAGWTLASAAHAQATCQYLADNPYGARSFNATVPLNIANLTIGRDTPNGTILYRQTIGAQGNYRASCTAAVTSTTTARTLPVTPQPLSSWNSTPYPGKVYETGVPGIGVAIWWASQVYPVTSTAPQSSSVAVNYTLPGVFDMTLIKIGAVSPGTISGANLPTAQYAFGSTGGSLLTLSRINFSGSIRIVAQTCTTPDVHVPLGEHKTSAFTGAGSSTDWRDFNIRLQNCPAFFGRSASLRNTDSPTGWVESNRSVIPNYLALTLTPTTTIEPTFPGTVHVSQTTSGPAAATGVGVQIVRASNAPVMFNGLMASGITPTDVSGAEYSIPLRARYIQIQPGVTPGPANTSVMFTINYQ